MQYKRKRRWIRADLQLRVILLSWGVALVGLLVAFQLALTIFGHYRATVTAEELVSRVPSIQLWSFVAGISVVIILAVGFGIRASFPFCGPLYRFKEHFKGFVAGRWDVPCRIRRGDDLHDIKDVINDGVAAIVRNVKEQHALLDEMRQVVETNRAAFPDESRVSDLLARAERTLDETAARVSAVRTGDSGEPTNTNVKTNVTKETDVVAS